MYGWRNFFSLEKPEIFPRFKLICDDRAPARKVCESVCRAAGGSAMIHLEISTRGPYIKRSSDREVITPARFAIAWGASIL